MKLFVSVLIFGMILFLLAISFKKYPNEDISQADAAGAALVGAGIQAQEETPAQMQRQENVLQSQQEGETVLDMAVDAAKNEIKKWEEGYMRFVHDVWDKTKESAFQMATDTAELIYPSKTSAKTSASLKEKQTHAGK